MSKPRFQLTPVGGVGQIGSNMTLFEARHIRLLVDCGILFPFEDFFDLNYLIPNLDQLGHLDALIITHGHEDHIGAITHIISQYPNIKVFAPSFAAELIRFKLNQQKLSAQIEIYGPDTQIWSDEVAVHPIHVNHSIPQTYGLLFLDQQIDLACFFVSDFKVDDTSPYEAPFDFKKLSTLSSSFKRRYLLADSTNILSSKLKTTSESALIADFNSIFSNEGRIFATCFSSNIHRIQTIINCAAKNNRKVILYGGSMVKYTQIALSLGLLEDPKDTLREPTQISAENKHQVILCSGSQGEFRSTMTRVIRGEDSLYKPTSEDHFVFSSKAIPGNEKKLSMLFNLVSEWGAKLYTDQTHLIHASGHAGKDDLVSLFNHFRPTYFTPIHGETLFLEQHRDFARTQIPEAEIIDIKNNQTVTFFDSHFTTQLQPKIDPILIHGNGIEIDRKNISERRKMACGGVIFITLGTRLAQPIVSFSGVTNVFVKEMDDFPFLLNSFFDFKNSKKSDKLTEEVRVFTRRYFAELIGQKPVVFVHFSS